MLLQQTDEPHVLRLSLSAEELQGALQGGQVVMALGTRAAGAGGATAAAAQVLRVRQA
jgi:hypothetical protein